MSYPAIVNKTLYSGTRGQTIQPNSFIRDVSKYYLLEPHATPMWQFAFNQVQKKKVGQAVHEIQNDTLRPFYMNLTSGYTGGSPTTTYTDLPNISFFGVGDYFYNQNTSQILTAIAVNTTTGDVTLGTPDGTNVTTGTTADMFQYNNTPIEQGGAIQQSRSTVVDFTKNYAETFATPMSIDDSTVVSKLYQGSDWSTQETKIAKEHKIQIEQQFLTGVASGDSMVGPTSRRFYTTGGILSQIVTNKYAFTYGVSTFYDDVLTFAEQQAFDKGTKQKVLMVNRKWMRYLNSSTLANVRTVWGQQNSYGLKFKVWQSDFGDWAIVMNDFLNYRGKAMAVSLQAENIYGFYLRDTHTKEINPGRFQHKEVSLVTECGLAVAQESTHALMYES